jgi:hypothetical protein
MLLALQDTGIEAQPQGLLCHDQGPLLGSGAVACGKAQLYYAFDCTYVSSRLG